MLDGTQRRSEERDTEKAASVSSSEGSDGSASEKDKLPAETFWARLPPAWEEDRILPAIPCVDESRTDPEVDFDSSVRADLEDRA